MGLLTDECALVIPAKPFGTVAKSADLATVPKGLAGITKAHSSVNKPKLTF